MKIALVITSMRCGGAENVACLLSNHWAGSASVVVITLEPESTDFFQLDERVKRLVLGGAGVSGNRVIGLLRNLELLRRLALALRRERPDIVIAFMDQTNVLAVLAARGLSLPVIITQRNDIRTRDIGWIWGRLRRLAYPMANVIVAQSRSAAMAIRERVGGNVRIEVIPNPVRPNVSPSAAEASEPVAASAVQTLLFIGRLVPEKGADLLVDALGLVAERNVSWRLRVAGDGPELENLKRHVATAGIADRVEFLGLCRDVYGLLRSADMFVLSSRTEGYPNVLIEAMSAGVAVIATNCSQAMSEIVEHGENGLLVEPASPHALANAIVEMLDQPTMRERCARNAALKAKSFSLPVVSDTWCTLISELIHRVKN